MSKVTDLVSLYDRMNFSVYTELHELLLKTDSEIVVDQLCNLGEMYATYQGLAELAKKHYAKRNKEYEIWAAKRKQDWVAETGKKTAVALENFILTEPEYSERQEAIIIADEKWGYFKGLLRAMEMRRDALIQICSLKKKEAGIYN